MDPVTTGLLIAAAGGIVALFIRIEHRLTKVETSLTFILENLPGCQQHSEDPTP